MPTLETLTGAEHAEIEKALRAAFGSPAELNMFLVHQFDTRLAEVSNPENNLIRLTFDVVEWAVNRGTVDELLKRAVDELPGNPYLLSLTTRLQLGPSRDTDMALRAAMTGGARDVLKGFRDKFAETSRHIDALARHKRLHDILHNVQYRCLCPLRDLIDRFPADPRSVIEAVEPRAILTEKVAEAERYAAAAGIAPDRELPWLGELRVACAGLDAALKARDRKSLRDVVLKLSLTTSKYPPRIDMAMQNAADALALGDLRDALKAAGAGPDGTADPDLRRQLTQLADSIDGLTAQISGLVHAHSGWQLHDLDLQHVEDGLTISPAAWVDRLIPLWEGIKSQANDLLSEKAAGPLTDMLQAQFVRFDQLMATAPGAGDAAAAGPDAAAADRTLRDEFRNYRQLSGMAFFTVDTQIDDFCTDLKARLGKTLAELGGRV